MTGTRRRKWGCDMEQDVIGHLIDVERLAYDLLLDAQKEADRRKAAVKEQAEREFRAEYEKIIAELESEKASALSVCDERQAREYAEYDARLTSLTQDRAAFNDYLDSVFSGH